MKRFIIAGFLFLSLAACEKNENEAVPLPDLEVEKVSASHRTSVRTTGNTLQVELVAINDSRCPVNVNCVWAGSAALRFKVYDAQSETEVALDFSGADKTKNSVSFNLNGQGYLLRVSEVMPYPETSATPELSDYTVSVTIEKK
ncbi:hypothetical protein CLV98_103184 [Dyadobacter jejuensis]|uniref:Uncharacterized protein n=1 Tax=Dyadobacter jejuensis TaxID=1082580 RepID=A0A316B8A6_9BACT|nr:hypothetical protein [Dyadobacter jejuensis]PWJ58817.1 hypothetical protein CLV98_103184 [Dyadobacter jejuensis]